MTPYRICTTKLYKILYSNDNYNLFSLFFALAVDCFYCVFERQVVAVVVVALVAVVLALKLELKFTGSW